MCGLSIESRVACSILRYVIDPTKKDLKHTKLMLFGSLFAGHSRLVSRRRLTGAAKRAGVFGADRRGTLRGGCRVVPVPR